VPITEFCLFRSYLAQAIQMTFFFALIIHISSSVRQRIWFKESGNLSVSFNEHTVPLGKIPLRLKQTLLQLMRTMGLHESFELASWIITTFVELAIIFLLTEIILYGGGIMETSDKLLIYIYLLIFGLCVISFW
jgi:hypothetical protein